MAGVIAIHPPKNVRTVLDRYIHEPADSSTMKVILTALNDYYGHDKSFRINLGYDYYGYLHVMFEFDTEEDAVIFKLAFS